VSTQDESRYETRGRRGPTPGALIVFSEHAALLRCIPVTTGPVMLGREDAGGQPLPDGKLSRQHLELQFDGPGWTLRALGKNGTFVNGHRVEGTVRAAPGSVVRIARTLFILCDDLGPFVAADVATEDGLVIGPALRRALDQITVAAGPGPVSARTLLVQGETGTGKELAATTFHRVAAPKGPMVRFNCATLDSHTAQDALFGHLKGAFTGATSDKQGLLDEADGGVLFLDEIADLNLEVQPMLLRAIETGTFRPLGATADRRADVKYVSATHIDLERRMAEGRFRSDLFFRLAQARVQMPALRERREEVPWLLAHALAEAPVRAPHAELVEAAMLRRWPGNARDLIRDAHEAARRAAAREDKVVRLEDLPAEHASVAVSAPAQVVAAPASARAPRSAALDTPKEQVIAMLEQFGGNATKAAEALGLQRTQFNRLREKYGLLQKKTDDDDATGT
jgi:transcriptional regulator with GAF, ATPase, and Fis domain